MKSEAPRLTGSRHPSGSWICVGYGVSQGPGVCPLSLSWCQGSRPAQCPAAASSPCSESRSCNRILLGAFSPLPDVEMSILQPDGPGFRQGSGLWRKMPGQRKWVAGKAGLWPGLPSLPAVVQGPTSISGGGWLQPQPHFRARESARDLDKGLQWNSSDSDERWFVTPSQLRGARLPTSTNA